MFEKLDSEIELKNEIIFFMTNCLSLFSVDLTSTDMLPCIQLICKSLSQTTAIDLLNNLQIYVLERILIALNIVSLKNKGLLSSLTTDF